MSASLVPVALDACSGLRGRQGSGKGITPGGGVGPGSGGRRTGQGHQAPSPQADIIPGMAEPPVIRFHSTAAALLDDADKVRPYADNPRNGDVDAIAASILEVGCYRPVYAWAKTGEILAGNHTYAALLSLGAQQVPIAWVEADTMTEARKIVLGDNRHADRGRYDEALLLAELRALDGDLEGTGYDEMDVDNIAALLASGDWGDADGSAGAGAGDPDDEAFNPRIDLRVSARIFDGWRKMLDQYDGDDDAAKLAAHLDDLGLLP